jgi:hypothetical protein
MNSVGTERIRSAEGIMKYYNTSDHVGKYPMGFCDRMESELPFVRRNPILCVSLELTIKKLELLSL